MTDSIKQPPDAGPKTQSAPAARSGGTYGQEDFSISAQRSRLETDQFGNRPMSPKAAEAIAQSNQAERRDKP